MSVAGGRMDALLHRRRILTGATGCGLCGMESLAEAARPPPRRCQHACASRRARSPSAPIALAQWQSLNAATHAVHAAGFWTAADGITVVREDVGRHNALDKLAGALAGRGADASQGVVVLTSRVSVEMVQKTAVIGSPVIMAVSAPTALALRVATEAGITLIGIARGDGFEVFTHPDRIVLEARRMSAERLVTMANQIGHFFAHRGEQAPELIATHIRQFWDPRMRAAMLAHFAEAGLGSRSIAACGARVASGRRASQRDQAPPAAPR